MADALAQVKKEFGAGAVILTTRSATRGKVLGGEGKPYVEITAARDVSSLPPAIGRGTFLTRPDRNKRAEGAAASMTTTTSRIAPTPTTDSLLSEVGALRTLVGELVHESRKSRVPSVPAELLEFHQRLVANDVAAELAEQLLSETRRGLTAKQLRDVKVVRAKLADALMAMLPGAGPIELRRTARPYVVALVGPTGVGKTTTVAKLAANLCLRESAKVGLITLDTYRIAAVEQLRTYAQIIDVPLEVVSSPLELRKAMAVMADRDVVFFDTAGRSQRDSTRIGELQEFFETVRPHETHLVLSATANQRVLTEALERFAPLGFDRVIFTKLDEAIGFGVILNCLQKVKARLSYVTTGQDVPSDIRVGETRLMADLILGESLDGEPAANTG